MNLEPGTRVVGRGCFTNNMYLGVVIRTERSGNVVIREDVSRAQKHLKPNTVRLAAPLVVPETDDHQPSVREAVLDEAKTMITGDRNRSYGSPTQNFQNTADLWTVQFRHKLKPGERFTASDMASAMIHLKQARRIAGDKRDNWVDTVGYAACGAECDAEDNP